MSTHWFLVSHCVYIPFVFDVNLARDDSVVIVVSSLMLLMTDQVPNVGKLHMHMQFPQKKPLESIRSATRTQAETANKAVCLVVSKPFLKALKPRNLSLS